MLRKILTATTAAAVFGTAAAADINTVCSEEEAAEILNVDKAENIFQEVLKGIYRADAECVVEEVEFKPETEFDSIKLGEAATLKGFRHDDGRVVLKVTNSN